MDVQEYYTNMLRCEKKKISDCISRSLKPRELTLVDLKITEDGYAIDVAPMPHCKGMSFRELCKKIDRLVFGDFIVVDTVYSAHVVSLMLAPITADSMSDFIWNYIMYYLPYMNGIEALALGVAALEHIIEPMEDEVKVEYDKLIKIL